MGSLLRRMLQRLSDNYKKTPDSRIGKLLTLFAVELQSLEDTLLRVEQWRDIDQARGATLDRIGKNVVQPRGQATDEVYRIMLKSKIARNLSTGDINTIIRVLSIALDSEPSEIEITELYASPDPEPAAISLIRIPISRLNEVGMEPGQFARIVQRTLAAGVRAGVIELTGTFEFGATETTDNETGFADLAGTIGGYLGAAVSGDEDLPI